MYFASRPAHECWLQRCKKLKSWPSKDWLCKVRQWASDLQLTFVDVCNTKLLRTWRNTAHHSQTLLVDSVFAQPAATFFLCHVIVELLAVGPSLLLVRRRGTLYLTIYVICHVAIGILNVSSNPFCSPSTSAHSTLEVFNIDALYKFTLSLYLSIWAAYVTLQSVMSEECRCERTEIADRIVVCHTTWLDTNCNQFIEIFCPVLSPNTLTTASELYQTQHISGSGSGLLTYNSHMARLWNTERVTTYIKKPKAYNKVLKY